MFTRKRDDQKILTDLEMLHQNYYLQFSQITANYRKLALEFVHMKAQPASINIDAQRELVDNAQQATLKSMSDSVIQAREEVQREKKNVESLQQQLRQEVEMSNQKVLVIQCIDSIILCGFE